MRWVKVLREINNYLLYLKVISSDNKNSFNGCLNRGYGTPVFIF